MNAKEANELAIKCYDRFQKNQECLCKPELERILMLIKSTALEGKFHIGISKDDISYMATLRLLEDLGYKITETYRSYWVSWYGYQVSI